MDYYSETHVFNNNYNDIIWTLFLCVHAINALLNNFYYPFFCAPFLFWYIFNQRQKVRNLRSITQNIITDVEFYNLLEMVKPCKKFAVKYFIFIVIQCAYIASKNVMEDGFFINPWYLFVVLSIFGIYSAYTFEQTYEHYRAVYVAIEKQILKPTVHVSNI